MRLRENVISMLKDPKVRRRLCDILDVTDQTIRTHIAENRENGPLTLYAVVLFIKDAFGMKEKDIITGLH